MPFIDALAPFAEAVDKWKTDKDRALELLGMSQEILKSELGIQEARNKYAQTMESMVKANQAQRLGPIIEEYNRQRAIKEGKLGESAGALADIRKVEAETKQATQESDIEMAKERLKTQQETTKLRTEQTKVAQSRASSPTDYQKIIDMTPELQGTPPTKDAITTRLKILRDQALNNKDTKQVEYLDSRIDYTEAQTDVAQAREDKLRKEIGRIGLAKGYATSLNDFKLGLINQMIADGIDPNDAFDRVMHPVTPNILSALINGARKRLEASLDDEEKVKIQAEIKEYQDILAGRLSPYKSKEKQETKTPIQRTGNTAIITPQKWAEIKPQERTQFYKDLAKDGIREVRYINQGGGIIATSQLDENGRIFSRIEGKSTTEKPATIQQAQAQAKPMAISPEAQRIVDGAKARGVKSIRDIPDKDIAQLKAMGLYDEVLRGLGGK